MSELAVLEPPAPIASTTHPTLADLILLRLLPEKQSVAPKTLRTDLAVFFRAVPSAEQTGEVIAALRAEGFIAPKGQRATDAGRARALQFLGVEKLPPRSNWRTVKAKYLVPRALGLAPNSAETEKTVGKKEKLAPLLLKRALGLPAVTEPTLSKVFEAIACKQLGYPNHTTLKELVPVLLAKAIESDTLIGGKIAEQVVPQVLLKAKQKGMAGLRAVALSGWVSGETAPRLIPTQPTEPDESFDLEMFANTVKAMARKCPTGRFGDYKVFISHVWNQLRDEPRFAPLGPDGFKAKLVEANQARLLNLLPADLNQAFDAEDLTASQTGQRNSTYHLIDTGAQS